MNFEIQDGLSQSERKTPYLDPHYFQLEERETGDFLKFIIDLASHFNYYNFNNQPDGSWEGFFDSDIDVLVAVIIRLDIAGSIRQFEESIRHLNEAEDEEEIATALNWMFSFLQNGSAMLLKFKRKLELAINRNADTAEMAIITEGVEKDIATLISYYYQAVQVFPNINYISFPTESASVIGNIAFDKERNIWLQGNSLKERMDYSVPLLQDLFAEFRLRYHRLKAAGEQYVQKLRHEGSTFSPHVGLMITFLQLYKYLKKEINTITGRHLDFYYKEVLGIAPIAQIPDYVHLLFEPAFNISKFTLRAGEEVVAEIPVTKQRLLYQIVQDTTIGKEKIKELKTYYISRQLQIPAKLYEQAPVEELKVYMGDYAVIPAESYTKLKEFIQPWPILGEEQATLPVQQRNMEDAVIGIVIGSPVLYLPDGKRKITLQLHLTKSSTNWFKQYVSNFAHLKGVADELMMYELLATAFNISFTGPNDWITVKKYGCRFSVESGKDTFIEITFIVTEKQPSVIVYHSDVHGSSIQLNAPAIKLTISGTSFHNAYSFLRQLEIERVSINADVIGSKAVQLQNSFGPLSVQTPFQPFGPLPSLDSYFEIKSTNIFNRFTKQFSIHLFWFDLPKEPGGFETYFEGYDNDVTNDSFKVALSTVQNGRNLPEDKARKSYNLFSSIRDKNGKLILKEDSEIGTSDVLPLGFTNRPLMEEEDDSTVTRLVKEGIVKLELIAPTDAFGYKRYPQLLPDIIMNNARRFSKKMQVPNLPYVPVLKTLHVDYTLTHSEAIAKNKMDSSGAEITLIHLHPFGFNTVFPSTTVAPIYCAPLPEEGSSLLIGLEGTMPGQEVSLLFQLQEMNFHHTAHEIEDVKWRYLCDNEWIYLKPTDVLSDSTNNFINSGIIKILLPTNSCNNNTILAPGLFWLSAYVSTTQIADSKVVGIFTQAATAVRATGKLLSNTIESLPPGIIKEFNKKVPEIIHIRQLFPSWGGCSAEDTEDYRLRISERLRHKNRPLTALGISQMILQNFPEIAMVKCFGPGSSEDFILPDVNVQVVVLPKERSKEQFLTEEPKVSLAMLYRIKQYINKLTSCFARIEVGNPVYEKIKIVCSIDIKKDKTNTNNGHYIKRLNEDIKRFISPWLFSTNQEVKIGGKVFILDVLNFIQERSYINYVTGFSVLHFFRKYNRQSGAYESVMRDSSTSAINYMQASRPDAILIAVPDHFIIVLNDPSYAVPTQSGIGDLSVGSELGVGQVTKESVVVSEKTDQQEGTYYDFTF